MLGVMACTFTRQEKGRGSNNVLGLMLSVQAVLDLNLREQCNGYKMICCT